MTTLITADNLAANTITAEKISSAVALGGPRIANVQIANSSWSQLDDTAVDTAGGYVIINGSGFSSGCQVLINSTTATSVTFVSSSVLRVQVPAKDANTYVMYVVNPDGGTAIGVNALTYSGSPTWVTGSTLTEQLVDAAISIQLSATGANTYSLQAGSSVPANTTLASNGLFSGTVTGIASNTTYSFTVLATDSENQDSPRTFSVTVTVIPTDQYFNLTTLLLQGNGSNNTNNNTFLDDSPNNFTITRNGNTTQGTFSPFSPTGWSNYFDGNGDYISASDNEVFALGSDNFTIEFWIFPTSAAEAQLFGQVNSTFAISTLSTTAQLQSGGQLQWMVGSGSNYLTSTSTTAMSFNSWTHVAMVRNGNTGYFYFNGVQDATTFDLTGRSLNNSSTPFTIGRVGDYNTLYFQGYISNFRLVKGTAVYTSNFTPSTTPLTAVSGTSLLTCQSNRFIDNSTNNFTITASGNTSVQAFSPFAPAAAWSAATYGGSGYFDGTGDYLQSSGAGGFNAWSGDWTVEGWMYCTDSSNSDWLFVGTDASNNKRFYAGFLGTTFYLGDGIINTLEVSSAKRTNEWMHLAVVKNGSVHKAYINGISIGTSSTSLDNTALSFWDVGLYAGSYLKGYVSGARVVKGTAVYTSNFTPPTAPPTAIANTSLLLNFTNAGIYDATAKNVLETVGNAQVRTDVKKYGAGSLYFDGTGDYLSVPYNTLVNNLGTSNFTIEAWIYFNVAPASVQPLSGYNSGSTNWAIYIDNSVISYYISSNGSTWNIASGISFGSAVSTGQWYHIALVRNGSTFTPYLNGTAGTTSSSSAAIYNNSGPIYIGGIPSGYGLNGYIDDLRITKGIARYTSNFTPPTTGLPVQ